MTHRIERVGTVHVPLARAGFRGLRRALACLRALYERNRNVTAERRMLLRLAESPHLLEDVGMTREEALREASRAFYGGRSRGGKATGRPP